MSKDQRDACLQDWMDREAIAESMIPLIGTLYRQKSIVSSIYGRPVINRSVIELLKAHRFVRHMENEELSVQDTYPLLQALTEMDVAQAHIDLGKLAVKYRTEGNGKDVKEFLAEELASLNGEAGDSENRDVVLYGFGRIGRLLARILIEKEGGGNGLRLRAIVVRRGKGDDLVKRASLLRRDSVHGTFRGSISIDHENEAIIANGTYIKIIYANNPAEIDYTEFGIENALVIDNTGVWRDEAGLAQHLEAKGTARVLLTAPGKGDLKNIVYGINNKDIDASDKILSAASCTTNAITPVLKVMNDQYGIENGHVETVHSYTNDQNLIDNYHKGDRRGRSAPLNMVITETGAASAVAKALPELKGLLSGNAIRVPTPNVSMAILSLNLKKETSAEEVNDFLRDQALHSSVQKQIDWVNSPEVVSTDFVGNSHAGIVDAKATIVNGNRVNLYVWYDNEYGYSRQVVRIAQQVCGVEYPTYPSRG
ncbi:MULTISPECIES: glyceraldehyde-3-phosphate dehydrogenase [Thalassolituus]|uniref:Glyceraldehyde-3-phosphate dehydrogenase n=1 Tax=Thalassolituus maritimus TaxID=484498 RepID=A0A1N7N9H6_9GAMM|nr:MULTISPECIES: glyceraldehyde-3-phosphate dehydrogenase [Thalassolituus]MAX87284.1 glyceraldehyde-3-phosphate dehydrogenase [Oceanospirillaceae bacterium]MEC9409601.1 glyceraldehyde-3-phosphate dehydrogenase [Pseudomonadota bacterium]MED5442146.1 glyceraldehyde-3-phosphate dehydrogenase [Pseudomonadota bacterium]MEE3161494.1 glyceraldehyde-3-phosphate dehydrogenase [Pseudomonadota bacterium]MEE3191174.1 glyceraldehyde-3-phosphate dehydrogenase [Pseudomonadota bacterium]